MTSQMAISRQEERRAKRSTPPRKGAAGLRGLSAALSVLAFAACEPRAVDLAAEEQAIRTLSVQWLELDKRRDAVGVAALFAEDAVVLRGGREPVVGRAAIESSLAAAMAGNPHAVPAWTTEGVEVARSGDFAIERGTLAQTNLGPDGTGEEHGSYSTVYRKVDGEWKVAVDAAVLSQPAVSLDLSVAEPAIRARLEALEAAWNARDAAAIAAMYAPEGDLVVVAGPRSVGPDAIRDAFAMLSGLPADCRIGITLAAVRMLAPTVAVVDTDGRFTACGDAVPAEDRATYVWQQRGEEWFAATVRIGVAAE